MMRILETLKLTLAAGGVAGLMATTALAQSTQPAPEAPSASETAPAPGQLPDAIKAPSAPAGAPTGGSTTVEKAPTGDSAAQPGAASKSAEAPVTKKLIGMPVYTSDGQRIGRVAAVAMSTDGEVKELHAKVGGFLGFGGTLVRIDADKYQQAGKRVQLSMNAKQAETLPKVEKPANS